jgi:hypothetical protein
MWQCSAAAFLAALVRRVVLVSDDDFVACFDFVAFMARQWFFAASYHFGWHNKF